LEQLGIVQNKPCGGLGKCGKCKVTANGKQVLACCTYINENTCIDYTTNIGDIQGVTKGILKNFDKKPMAESGYGMAIDIGTTTIAGYIYKFPQCECVMSDSVANTQSVCGADVISRIEYSNKGGLLKLQEAVIRQIKKLSEGFEIDKYVITGNTAMLHFLTAKDPKGLGVAPFTPESLFGEFLGKAYLPPCISAYVGADITTAVLASGMLDKKTSFLVDIGTNGEMALWHNNKLICCSTAAGPAFEGAGISCGVPAVSGAINRVYIENGEVKYTTIDNKSPVGICGTGLIDAIACMLSLGIIDNSGYMEEDFKIGDSDICITSLDVRNVQLAKSAISSGIETLMYVSGVSCDDIETFYIAGGFGSYINKENAVKIGLIPGKIAEKTVSAGNCAGTGAAMILQNSDFIKTAEEIAKAAETEELSQNAYFMQRYIENMMFGDEIL